MLFELFYPYATNAAETPEKTWMDETFQELKRIEEAGQNLILFDNRKDLFSKCDAVINKATYSNFNSLILASCAFAVKMEICLRMSSECDEPLKSEAIENIRKNFDHFLLILESFKEARRKQSAKEDITQTFNLGSLYRIEDLSSQLISLLPKALDIADGFDSENLSVPEFLASKLRVSGNFERQRFRVMLHKAWHEVPSLQPLLTIMAYSSLGAKIEDEETYPLRTIIVGTSSGGTTGLSARNKTFISLGRSNSAILNPTNTEIATDPRATATLIHEWWHQAENRIYQNNSYPYKKDGDLSKQELLAKMRLEVQKLTNESDIEIIGEFGLEIPKIYRRSVLSSTFKSLEIYENKELDAELPVRVPQALIEMCLGAGMSEDDAKDRMRKAGLVDCVKFFEMEVEEMQEIAKGMGIKYGFRFSPPTKNFVDHPQYSKCSTTPMHEAIERAAKTNDYTELDLLLKSLKEEAKKQNTPYLKTIDPQYHAS